MLSSTEASNRSPVLMTAPPHLIIGILSHYHHLFYFIVVISYHIFTTCSIAAYIHRSGLFSSIVPPAFEAYNTSSSFKMHMTDLEYTSVNNVMTKRHGVCSQQIRHITSGETDQSTVSPSLPLFLYDAFTYVHTRNHDTVRWSICPRLTES